MIYVCNFYAHGKEAVSNEIEILRKHTRGSLFAAGIFLDQLHLTKKDVREKRTIISEKDYQRSLPGFIKALPRKEPIHYFSEEPEPDKIAVFNSVSNDLYITMYRRPNARYAAYLKKFAHIAKVFVELECHKDILNEHGLDPERIVVVPPPSILERSFSPRKFSGKFLFASWNGGDAETLEKRGLIAILDILSANTGVVCEIALRDKDTTRYRNVIWSRGLEKRMLLSDIHSRSSIRAAFQRADAVFFLMKKKLTKDVPNSIIDGFSLGKPVLMTNVVDLAEEVKKHDLGWVIRPGEKFDVQKAAGAYQRKAKNAFFYSKEFAPQKYIARTISAYKAERV